MKILIDVQAPGWDGSPPAGEIRLETQLVAYVTRLVRDTIKREPKIELSIVSDGFVLVNAEQLLRLHNLAEELQQSFDGKKNCRHMDAIDLGVVSELWQLPDDERGQVGALEECHGRGAGDALCLLLPSILSELGLEPMTDAQARDFLRELSQALRDDLRRAA